jgi:rhamnosyl/mannosyltransferase
MQPLHVLFVGQMRPYKGIEWLLPAVARQREIDLTLVGGGPHLREYQMRAVDLGSNNVRFLGRISDADLQVQYSRSDVIVLPSVTRAEAFGLVVLEGMAVGCVPVVSDLPGVRDLVAHTGVVVPPRDVGALRAALGGLAEDGTRLEHLRRAAWRRAEGLGWDACVTGYENAFIDAIGLAGTTPWAMPSPRPSPRTDPVWSAPAVLTTVSAGATSPAYPGHREDGRARG